MDRINRITREVKSHQEVCRLTNASIPVDQDYGDWLVIHSMPTPDLLENQILVSNGITESEGRFYYDWAVQTVEVKPYVPQSVSRLQGLAQLHHEGVLDQIDTYMASPDRSVIEQLAWKNAQTFDRDSVLVQTMAAYLNWSDEKLDQVFADANKIAV